MPSSTKGAWIKLFRCADELHDLDFFFARKERQLDRAPDDKQSRQEQHAAQNPFRPPDREHHQLQPLDPLLRILNAGNVVVVS